MKQLSITFVLILFAVSTLLAWPKLEQKNYVDTTISGVVYVDGGSPPPGYNVVSGMEVQLFKWDAITENWVQDYSVATEPNGTFYMQEGVVDCPAGGPYKVRAVALCCGLDGDFTYPGPKASYLLDIDCESHITGLTFNYNYKFY